MPVSRKSIVLIAYIILYYPSFSWQDPNYASSSIIELRSVLEQFHKNADRRNIRNLSEEEIKELTLLFTGYMIYQPVNKRPTKLTSFLRQPSPGFTHYISHLVEPINIRPKYENLVSATYKLRIFILKKDSVFIQQRCMRANLIVENGITKIKELIELPIIESDKFHIKEYYSLKADSLWKGIRGLYSEAKKFYHDGKKLEKLVDGFLRRNKINSRVIVKCPEFNWNLKSADEFKSNLIADLQKNQLSGEYDYQDGEKALIDTRTDFSDSTISKINLILKRCIGNHECTNTSKGYRQIEGSYNIVFYQDSITAITSDTDYVDKKLHPLFNVEFAENYQFILKWAPLVILGMLLGLFIAYLRKPTWPDLFNWAKKKINAKSLLSIGKILAIIYIYIVSLVFTTLFFILGIEPEVYYGLDSSFSSEEQWNSFALSTRWWKVIILSIKASLSYSLVPTIMKKIIENKDRNGENKDRNGENKDRKKKRKGLPITRSWKYRLTSKNR